MARRECGACRFFQKSGIGETGYCHNERCRDIVGIALVRKHELACRVGWDQDFFESARVAAIPGEERPPAEATRGRGYQGTHPDDLVVAVEQVRPMSKEIPTQSIIGRKPPSHVSEAHRRALERKQQAQANGTPVPVRRLDGVAPTPTVPSPPQPAPPNTSGEWQQAGAEGVSLPRRPEPFAPLAPQSAPPSPALFAPSESVNANARTTSLPVVGGNAPLSSPPPRDSRDAVAPRTPAREPRPLEHSERYAAPATPSDGGPPGAVAPESLLLSPPPHAESSSFPEESYAPHPPGEGVTAPPDDASVGDLHAQWYAAERGRHRGKRCGNCRDFRPDESGEHGYCRNRFAFPAPQLVTPSDLACLSALGTWWAANDQWWLSHATNGENEGETPRADAVLDELQAREDQTRRRPRSG